MTSVVIASVPVYSHVAPLLVIAEDLAKRGYPVTFLTGSRFEEAVDASGVTFAGFPVDADYDPARLNDEFPERANLEGRHRLEFDMRHHLTNPIPAQHRGLQKLLQAAADDPVVVIHENGFLGMWPVLLGSPGIRPAGVIGVGIQPLTITSVDTAPFGTGLPPDSSPEGRVRNQAANKRMQEEFFGGVQANLVRTLELARAVVLLANCVGSASRGGTPASIRSHYSGQRDRRAWGRSIALVVGGQLRLCWAGSMQASGDVAPLLDRVGGRPR